MTVAEMTMRLVDLTGPSVAEMPAARRIERIEPPPARVRMDTVVVLPTYNEKDNLPGMLTALRTLCPGVDIVVVDDNSPDGTGHIAQEWANCNPAVHVVHRRDERGLGTAYRAGFAYALECGARAVITMDCDFSHAPHDIPRLLGALNRADLVIGSRYVGGGATRNWPWTRKVMSAAANLFARSCMKLPTHDCTSGFRAYRGSLLRQLLNEPAGSQGYTMLVELLSRSMHEFNARVIEVPIVFSERERGQSKISRKEITRGLSALLALRRNIFGSKAH